MPLDYTYRIELPHRPGQLATVAGTIAEGHGLIGDVVTINVGRETSVREITVEMKDREVAEHLSGMLNDLDGVKVLWAQDRALLRHEGGKLSIETTRPVRSVQDMRDVSLVYTQVSIPLVLQPFYSYIKVSLFHFVGEYVLHDLF